MSFQLHPQLEKDLILLSENSLFQIRLMPNSQNPWCVLIPKFDNIRELYELEDEDQLEIMTAVNHMAKKMASEFKADKMNIGMLGNMVPQLHIHIICRYQGDVAWPGSIWGTKLDKDEIQVLKLAEKMKSLIL